MCLDEKKNSTWMGQMSEIISTSLTKTCGIYQNCSGASGSKFV